MTSSKSEHVINTTSQKSNDTKSNDTTKVFKLPPIIHTGNSTTTTTVDMNDNLNGRRSLRKKIVPPKRYAKSPINTIDVKIGSSTNDSSVQPSTSIPPPTNNNTAQQSIKPDSTAINNTMKKRASPRKIKIPSRFIQDGSPTINNNFDTTLSSTTATSAATTVAAMNPPQQPTANNMDKGTSNIIGGSSAAAVPTKRSSSRKITIPAKFTNEEAKLISETCHSISTKGQDSTDMHGQGIGSTDMQGQGIVNNTVKGQGIVDNNTVKGLKLDNKAEAVSRSSSRSLPPVIHNNNNPINNSSTANTSISSGAVQQQQQYEKPKRGQAGRDAIKAKRAAAVLATSDGGTPSLTKKKQSNNKKEASSKEVTVTKKRSSRRKVPPPSTSSDSKSVSKSTSTKSSKGNTVNSNSKRTPAQLKYDTNRPIQSKWLNFYTLLQSYKLKYSTTIVMNSSNSNSGSKVGIDLNSLGKGTNSKSGKYRQAKKEEEIVGKSAFVLFYHVHVYV